MSPPFANRESPMPTRPLIRSFRPEDEAAVIALWTACGLVVSWNDPSKDIRRKLEHGGDLFLVAELDGAVVGTAMLGYEGHRGWVNYVGVDPALRRSGVGRALMAAAAERLRALGCPKINLEVRRTNRAAMVFYESLGYRDNDVVSYGLRLEEDGPWPAPPPPGPELATVIVFSPRPEELAAFYGEVFAIAAWERSPGHRGCRLGSVWFGIDDAPEAAAPSGGEPPASLRGAGFWVTVDDLDAAWARARAAGARPRREPADMPWGVRLASAWDPQGNLFGLIQR